MRRSLSKCIDPDKLVATHSLYSVWANMRQRCNDKNHTSYPRYGGRGINVCRRWNNFHNFLDDMGERPPNHQIHRLDNKGNYEPKNCIWIHRDKHNSLSRFITTIE